MLLGGGLKVNGGALSGTSVALVDIHLWLKGYFKQKVLVSLLIDEQITSTLPFRRALY